MPAVIPVTSTSAAALAVTLVLLIAIVSSQAYFFWLEQTILPYLALYGAFVAGILACLTMAGVGVTYS